MKLSRPLLMLAFVALILLGLYQTIDIRRPDRPVGHIGQIAGLRDRDDVNVVVVLVDTLRADRLSAYGYDRKTSPVMDGLAETGIRFSNTLAQSTWTKTSMASMLTATYPVKNRITRFNHVIPEGATLMSEIFHDAGFQTVGIWRNGWVKDNFGFNQGWDAYIKPRGTRPDFNKNPSSVKLGGTDQDILNAAVQFVRSAGDKRFLLYLHLMDVHQYVYDDSVDFGRTYSDIYDQAIHWVDGNVGTLVAVLQQRGLMKKTILAVVADHGEAFLEHGTEGHAVNLYTEVTQVPFILALPFRLEKPLVIDTPVENVDIVPTLLDLVGLPPLPEADGTSLVPLIEAAGRGEAPATLKGHEERVSFLDRNWGRPYLDPLPYLMVERGGFRLHIHEGEEGQPGSAKLFDIRKDRGETTDVAGVDPEQAKELRSDAGKLLSTPEPSWGGPGWVEVDDMEAAQLRALGYAVDPHAPPNQQKVGEPTQIRERSAALARKRQKAAK